MANVPAPLAKLPKSNLNVNASTANSGIVSPKYTLLLDAFPAPAFKTNTGVVDPTSTSAA
jgi:hypothetical protein